jgi:hypothetical protein
MHEGKRSYMDKTKMNSFLDKVFRDISGTYVSLMCCIGDRLDLFKMLEVNGPTISPELSRSAGINELLCKRVA